MRAVLFCHSLRSDWNNGNAHFLRGIVTELISRGNSVSVYEPEDSWSAANLVLDHGSDALSLWRSRYPMAESTPYREDTLDLDKVLSGADLVIVHEWNSRSLVAALGMHCKLTRDAGESSYRLLFHDTHHRSVTDPAAMESYDLSGYDGVLAFGKVISEIYIERGWAERSWTWHEAADTRVFQPAATSQEHEGDLVWIGNWGEGRRASELEEFLIEPVRKLGLKATVYGVRYPEDARNKLARAGIKYRGWLTNFDAPEIYARYRFTIHVPRRPYVEALPGIPTIRVFEALACGIPLISAPWIDSENLFTAGCEYVMAHDGTEMKLAMNKLMESASLRAELAANGLDAIQTRHSCAHRVDELTNIYYELISDPLPRRHLASKT